MGRIDKAGKKVLLKLPDLKLISLSRDIMPYISVQADGLSFIFKNTDHSILDNMVKDKKIWSRDEMDFIIGYYDSISARPGNVIDIGANVGTSVVYFRHRLGDSTGYYAVEPVTENYNLLNANCAVNGYSDIKTFRFGISDAAGEAEMVISPNNMATCKIAGSDDDDLVQRQDEDTYVGESVPLITLDAFMTDNKIGLDSPVLFWIDVEGHEPEVFRGGIKTFSGSDAAVFCEYNPRLYKQNGRYEEFLRDIKSCFGRFICYEQSEKGTYSFRDINELDKVAGENEMNQCNLFLVK